MPVIIFLMLLFLTACAPDALSEKEKAERAAELLKCEREFNKECLDKFLIINPSAIVTAADWRYDCTSYNHPSRYFILNKKTTILCSRLNLKNGLIIDLEHISTIKE